MSSFNPQHRAPRHLALSLVHNEVIKQRGEVGSWSCSQEMEGLGGDCPATLLGATSQAPPTCPVSRWHEPQPHRALLQESGWRSCGGARKCRVWGWASRRQGAPQERWEAEGSPLALGPTLEGVQERGSGRALEEARHEVRMPGWGSGGGAAPGVAGQAVVLGKQGGGEWERPWTKRTGFGWGPTGKWSSLWDQGPVCVSFREYGDEKPLG